MIEVLNIEDKTNNQGVSSAGKLTAAEFNSTRDKINELVDSANEVNDYIDEANKTVYLTQDEYDALIDAGTVQDDVEYNIYEE